MNQGCTLTSLYTFSISNFQLLFFSKERWLSLSYVNDYLFQKILLVSMSMRTSRYHKSFLNVSHLKIIMPTAKFRYHNLIINHMPWKKLTTRSLLRRVELPGGEKKHLTSLTHSIFLSMMPIASDSTPKPSAQC